MRGLSGGLLLLLLLAGAPSWAAAAGSTARCKPQLMEELDLTVEKGGHVLVPVSIEGVPVWMVLYTESPLTLLLAPAIERLHLTTALIGAGPAGVIIGKQQFTHRTTLSTLVAGGHRYTPVIAGILPGSENEALVEVDGKPIVGYLGSEVLSRSDFELQLAQNKLRLFSPDHCRGMGAYWAEQYAETTFGRDPYGGIYVAMGLEGKLIESALSTGNALTSIDSEVTRKAYGFDATSADVEGRDEGRATYRAMSLTMPGLKVTDLRIGLRTSEDCGYRERIDSGSKAIAYGRCNLIFPMSLGRDVLQKMRLYFSLKERKIYFTENAASP